MNFAKFFLTSLLTAILTCGIFGMVFATLNTPLHVISSIGAMIGGIVWVTLFLLMAIDDLQK